MPLEQDDRATSPRCSTVLLGPWSRSLTMSRIVPMQIAGFIDRPLLVLGTDGVGMSDSREALRAHFGVDARSIVETVLDAL